jgi:hypothetical protein
LASPRGAPGEAPPCLRQRPGASHPTGSEGGGPISASLPLIVSVLSATRRGRSDRRPVARLIASRSASLGSGLAAGGLALLRLRLGSGRLLGRRSHGVGPSTLRRIALRPGRLLPLRAWLPRWGFGLFGGFHSLPTREFAAGRRTCVRARAPVQRLKQTPETSQTPIRASEDRRIGGPCLKRELVAVRAVGLHHEAVAIDDPARSA